MFSNFNSYTNFINSFINKSSNNSEFIKFLEFNINSFLTSPKRKEMIIAENYYIGQHDILKRTRTILGKDGSPEVISNLPNNKIVDNQYARVIDQKNSYLLSKPITFYSKDSDFSNYINSILNKNFLKILKDIGEDALNYGISWLYLFINEDQQLQFKKFKSYEVLPFWADEQNTQLDMLVRVYDTQVFKNNYLQSITQVELYTLNGIYNFILSNGKLTPSSSSNFQPYITDSLNSQFSWSKIPIVSFKSNSKELPLISKVKSLQDSLNIIKSDFMNNMQEDARNTILIIKNYDGTNLAEFRKNLSEYGAVKVNTIDGSEGGVETLKVDIDSSNYELLAKSLKESIIEIAKGFNSRDSRISQSPNQMCIQSIYADIDLDATLMESEFQYSISYLLFFIKKFLFVYFNKKFDDSNLDVIFNKDILINESEAINNCLKSIGIISDELIVSQHPWVTDLQEELSKKSILSNP
ncbi:MAG: phage portal protein [bacterium]